MKKLPISREDLDRAADDGMISPKQADDLWNRFAKSFQDKPQFDLAHVAYYFGTLVVLIALGWFMGQMWDSLGGMGLLLTSLCYSLAFVLVGNNLRNNQENVPGGLLHTLAVAMTPIAIYSIERMSGMWEGNSALQPSLAPFLMAAGTVVTGLISLKLVRFPFLTAPISLAMWFATISGAELLFGQQGMTFDIFRWITLGFGSLMILGSYLLDRRTDDDYSFWGYLLGASAFWFALTFTNQDSEWLKLGYCAVNLGLMLMSVLLNRKIFVIYGSLGVVGYLFHLAFSVFANSTLFPFVLSLMGLGIIFLGVQYARNRERIDAAVMNLVPDAIKPWLPGARENRKAAR
jgi:hypothetical protein